MKKFLSAFFLLLVFFTAGPAWAKDVGLVVWVEDGLAFEKKNKALLLKNLAEANGTLPYKLFHIDGGLTSSEQLEPLPRLFEEGDRITHLVLATHGGTLAIHNQTQLHGLGRLGPEGPSGSLEELLGLLGARGLLAESLHVFMEACATFQGSEDLVKDRVQALYEYVQHYGVRNFSIWGALKPLPIREIRQMSMPRVIAHMHLKGVPYAAGLVAGTAIIVGGLAYYLQTPEQQVIDGIQRSSMMLAYLGGVLSAYATAWTAFQLASAGTEGRLATVTPEGIVVGPVDVFNHVALTGDCAAKLGPRP